MDIQQGITLGIVAIAGVSLGTRAYHQMRGTGGGHCAGCGECGRQPRPDVRPAPKATPLVTLSAGMPVRRVGVGPIKDPAQRASVLADATGAKV
jgi:hypothetical protein